MAEKTYKAPIGAIPATVLKLLANIGGAFTKRISHLPSRQIVDGMVTGFGKLVTALSDANPEDEAQIRAIVNEMLTSGDFYQGTRESVLANIAKIENENAQAALSLVLDKVYTVGSILTDPIEDNGAQLEAEMREFIASPEGISFFTSVLKLVLDDATANLIALILIEAVKGLVNDDRKEALEVLRSKLQDSVVELA